nr:MAG TPA: hypothetical protein [Caudoviricetes sp.]
MGRGEEEHPTVERTATDKRADAIRVFIVLIPLVLS